MKRILLMLAAVGCVSVVALSTTAQPLKTTEETGNSKFIISTEAKNPWTSLAPNVAADQFQFAIVSDRTGGHRKGVFSKAVQQVNLMQPSFVMSVGDLVEGAGKEEMIKQWEEFDKYARQFKMPFFYCTGNHDGDNKNKDSVWKERLGRNYYHFVYQNCLFLIVNSNDLVVANGRGAGPGVGFGKEQIAYVEKALKENENVRWTFVFMHHPVWTGRDLNANGWSDFEKLFAGRKYDMFCGHVHVFRKFLRNDRNYYQLATTGGDSALRGVEYGEFDQIAWVTMKKDGPVIAQIALEGIMKDDLTKIEPDPNETGSTPRKIEGLAEVVGIVTLDGKLTSGIQVNFNLLGGEGGFGASPSGIVLADGSFKVFSGRGEGAQPGRYAVTFSPAQSLTVDNKMKDNPVPEKYRANKTTPYTVTVKPDVRNKFEFKLESK